MDYTDILPIVTTYVNPVAVLLGIIITQGVKYTLKPIWSAQTVPGSVTTRLLPLLPLFIGAAWCVLLERQNPIILDRVVRGLMSGALAAYGYRTARVSIFGD